MSGYRIRGGGFRRATERTEGSCEEQSATHLLLLRLGASEDGHDLGLFTQHLEQLPTSLTHVGSPANQLFPVLRSSSEDAQVGDVLPVRRIWVGMWPGGRRRPGCGHR